MTYSGSPLVVIETHPVQYHAPVYHCLNDQLDVPVHAIYGSDFSVTRYVDEEFGVAVRWDTNLVREADSYTFLSRVTSGGATTPRDVSARGLGGVLSKLRPGAVLLTGYQPRFYLQAFYQVWRKGYPVLFRAETTDHADRRTIFKSRIRDRVLRSLYARCDRVLPIGARSAQHFRRLGCPERKLFPSPYCVDTSPFEMDELARERMRGRARQELNLARTDAVILFCGKLSDRKGPLLLLEAMKRLAAQTSPPAQLTFLAVGDGQQRPELEACSMAQPAIAARLVGFKNQSELSRYYHAADLFVLPSVRSETWGLVVNEALHHGVPCVVSDAVGCAPDLVIPGVTGYIAETGSIDSLKESLAAGLNLIGSRTVRNRCRDQVRGYTVRKAAEGIANAYWSLKDCQQRTAISS